MGTLCAGSRLLSLPPQGGATRDEQARTPFFARVPLLCLALLLCSAIPADAARHHWSPESFPNPGNDPAACGRAGVERSWVCDPEGILSRAGADLVEGVLRDIVAGEGPYNKSPCGDAGDQGFQVGVAVMRSMQRKSGEVELQSTSERFAVALHDAWGVGHAACNNGVLILVAVTDRQIYISTGTGARARLPDKAVTAIIETLKPKLRSGDYDAALHQAAVDVGMSLSQPPRPYGIIDFFTDYGLLIGLLGFAAVALYRDWRQGSHYRGARDKLRKLQDDFNASKRKAYVSRSCAICLEDYDEVPQGTVEGSGSPDGSEDATDAAGKKKSHKANGRKPFFMPCGHAFCEPCILEWVKKSQTCPICKKPLEEDKQPPPARAPPPPSPCAGQATHGGSASTSDASGSRTAGGDPQQYQENQRQEEQQAHAQEQRRGGMFGGMRYMGFGQRHNMHQPHVMDPLEFAFRMGMMQRRYPAYLTPRMADELRREAERQQHGNLDWFAPAAQAARAFQLQDPAVTRAQASAGSRGSSMSFGGGSRGGGGGGGGGSW